MTSMHTGRICAIQLWTKVADGVWEDCTSKFRIRQHASKLNVFWRYYVSLVPMYNMGEVHMSAIVIGS